jgi:mannose-6-phosphate isomerase-like protein (cupin superfamily)
MARTGDLLRQGDTDTMRFRGTAADSEGAFVEVEAEYDPMRDVRPPVHRHPRQDEHFEIVSGTMSFLVEDELHEVGPDGSIDIPRNTFHTVWNNGTERARFIWRTTPALKTEDMYVTLWGLADEGRMGRHGQPRPPFLQSVSPCTAIATSTGWPSPPTRSCCRCARCSPRSPGCSVTSPTTSGMRGHAQPKVSYDNVQKYPVVTRF